MRATITREREYIVGQNDDNDDAEKRDDNIL